MKLSAKTRNRLRKIRDELYDISVEYDVAELQLSDADAEDIASAHGALISFFERRGE